MSHELIISGGTVIDGTGADGVRADVAVDGGRITRVGDLGGERAAETIDATGKIVTPGFVDLHTHLDAQIGWDPEMRPSLYHGVTTALMGNCGVTFAPCGEANRRYLAELMESVEDMEPGFSRVSVELVDHLRNPNGQMHGGVIATLVDMSITQAMLMSDTYQRVRETRGLMTNVDLRMKYLRAVGAGRATVESRIVHEGRRVVHAASTSPTIAARPWPSVTRRS